MLVLLGIGNDCVRIEEVNIAPPDNMNMYEKDYNNVFRINRQITPIKQKLKQENKKLEQLINGEGDYKELKAYADDSIPVIEQKHKDYEVLSQKLRRSIEKLKEDIKKLEDAKPVLKTKYYKKMGSKHIVIQIQWSSRLMPPSNPNKLTAWMDANGLEKN